MIPALLALPTMSLLDGLAGDYIPLSLPPTGGRQGAINVGMVVVGLLWNGAFLVGAFLADRAGMFWVLVGVELMVLAVVHPLMLRGIRVRALKREGET